MVDCLILSDVNSFGHSFIYNSYSFSFFLWLATWKHSVFCPSLTPTIVSPGLRAKSTLSVWAYFRKMTLRFQLERSPLSKHSKRIAVMNIPKSKAIKLVGNHTVPPSLSPGRYLNEEGLHYGCNAW